MLFLKTTFSSTTFNKNGFAQYTIQEDFFFWNIPSFFKMLLIAHLGKITGLLLQENPSFYGCLFLARN